MYNLEQIRAKNALRSASKIEGGKEGGDILSGYHILIINNGLLATFAFSKKQGKGYEKIYNAIKEHLSCAEIGLLSKSDGLDDPLDKLCKSDSILLRLCTAETLAFLSYLRRFVNVRKSTSE